MDIDCAFAQVFGDGLPLLVEDISQDDLGSFFDEEPGLAFPLAPSCTRDDGHLAL